MTEINPQGERKAKIAAIQHKDRLAFSAWRKERPGNTDLDLSPAALWYLIPPVAFDRAEYPENVQVKPVPLDAPDYLLFYVVEPREVLSDVRNLGIDGSIRDPMHEEDDLREGVITENDFVFTRVFLNKPGNGHLHIISVAQRYNVEDKEPSVQEKEIDVSVADRLHEFAKESGFWIVTADEDRRSLTYSLENLGRKRVSALPEEIQEKIIENLHEGEDESRASYNKRITGYVLDQKD